MDIMSQTHRMITFRCCNEIEVVVLFTLVCFQCVLEGVPESGVNVEISTGNNLTGKHIRSNIQNITMVNIWHLFQITENP